MLLLRLLHGIHGGVVLLLRLLHEIHGGVVLLRLLHEI